MRTLFGIACFIIGGLYIAPSTIALSQHFSSGEPMAPLWAILAVAGAGLGWWTAAIVLTGRR